MDETLEGFKEMGSGAALPADWKVAWLKKTDERLEKNDSLTAMGHFKGGGEH